MGCPSHRGRGHRRFRRLRRRRPDLRHVPEGGAGLLHHPRRGPQERWQGPGRARGRACRSCRRLEDGPRAHPDQVRHHHQRQAALRRREARLGKLTTDMSQRPTSAKPKTMQERITELRTRREEVIAGGGEKRHAKQHEAGKLTARERIAELVDPLSFEESGMLAAILPADGVVTGAASVLGRPVHVASQDFSVAGGSAGEMHSVKVAAVMRSALNNGTPFVFINDSGGARVQEGIDSLSGYGKVFYENVALSGAVPQISVIAGPVSYTHLRAHETRHD